MPSLIYIIGILLLVFILPIASNYYVYTYDNDTGDDEHCCLVRLGEKFCLAKALTSSLLEVNKKCQRLSVNEKNKHYLNKIIQRLNVETSEKVKNKILLQLQKPLEKTILENDLLCLAANNNSINLEKCHIQLAAVKQKKQKHKNKNETVDEENPIHQVEVTEPIYIRTGRGLSVRQTFEFDLTEFRAKNSRQRKCWSWYRKTTKGILNHPRKSKKVCTSFNNKVEQCLTLLLYKQDSEDEQQFYINNSIKTGSKLYCENNNQKAKLLGYHHRSKICFTTHAQIYIDHKFTDLVNLSDRNKNIDVLKFISNNTKLTSEFESDCNDKKTLDDIKKLIEAEAETNTAEEEE